nr:hypothetical protein [uncultured Flavobacterium sp.]
MTEQELETLLTERCKTLDLKRKAFESLNEIFIENSNDEDFLNGFERDEIKKVFDGFKYLTDRRHGGSIIRTRIGLYVENLNWLENIQQIGYYELETDLFGEILDDWFVIEEEKFLKDIGIISHFQTMNKNLPVEYLRRNHLQYEFVTYISLVGTLFMSKKFEGSGRFIQRSYTYLEEKTDLLDKDFLKDCKDFLKMIKEYLLKNELVSEKLKEELTKKKNCG